MDNELFLAEHLKAMKAGHALHYPNSPAKATAAACLAYASHLAKGDARGLTDTSARYILAAHAKGHDTLRNMRSHFLNGTGATVNDLAAIMVTKPVKQGSLRKGGKGK